MHLQLDSHIRILDCVVNKSPDFGFTESDLQEVKNFMQYSGISINEAFREESAKFLIKPHEIDYDACMSFGASLVENDLFQLPFRKCFFQLNYAHKNFSSSSIFLSEVESDDRYGFFAIPTFLGEKANKTAFNVGIDDLLVYSKYKSQGDIGGISALTDFKNTGKSTIYDHKGRLFTYRAVLAVVGLLNSKGIEQTQVIPSESVNIKRAKQGRKPILGYTVVKVNQAKPIATGDGTHASPRPHWRRGHIRKLPTGSTTIVRPHPVMAGDSLPRPQTYIVK